MIESPSTSPINRKTVPEPFNCEPMAKHHAPHPPALYNPIYVRLSASNFLMISSMGCGLVYPLFILDFGGTKSDIGLLMGSMSLAAVLCRPLVSELIDRFGRMRSYVAGCLLMGVASGLHVFLQKPVETIFPVLLGLRLVYGIGSGLALVAGLTWAADIIPAARFNEGIGMFGATGLLGIAVGPLTAEWIIYRFGFPAMFISAGVISLGALAISLGIPDGYRAAAQTLRKSFLQMVRHPPLLRITLVGLCFGFGFAAHGSFVAPYARSQELYVSTYFLAYSAAAIVARLTMGRVADRIGETRLLPYALLLAGIGFSSVMWAHTRLGLCLAGLVTGLGHGVVFPSMLALAIRPIAAQNRGKANGVFTGGVDGGIFLGAVMLGFIGEHLGYQALFASAGGALFAGLAIYWTTSRYADPGYAVARHPQDKKSLREERAAHCDRPC